MRAHLSIHLTGRHVASSHSPLAYSLALRSFRHSTLRPSVFIKSLLWNCALPSIVHDPTSRFTRGPLGNNRQKLSNHHHQRVIRDRARSKSRNLSALSLGLHLFLRERPAAASERARVVLGHGRHYRRRRRGRRDGAVSYEPKLVGNTTAKDKWRGLMKWTDGRTRWPGFPDAGESSGSLAPPMREPVDYQLRI